MCYIEKSIEQVTSTCAMCKVFPPRRDHPCSHKDNMGVCKNRVLHPRHDVVYFRNAELTSFNGCGYCKWAKSNPKILASPDSAWRNPGWPGCCRPPKPSEYKYINAADWYAITKIHGIVAPLSPTRTSKSVPASIITPSVERRNSNTISSRRSSDTPQTAATSTIVTATTSVPVPATGARPPPLVTRETTIINLSPKSLITKPTTSSPIVASPTSSSSPSSSPPSSTSHSSPSSSSSASPSSVPPIERRVSTKTFAITETPFATLRGPPPNFNTSIPNPTPNSSRPSISSILNKPSTSVSSSSTSSRSSGSGSVTQSETVTSEGFTDYLSDESEAEMQREAERRAHEAEVVARLQRTKLELGREEQEFRAARNQLANVGLQPPPAWSSGKPVNAPATKEPQPPTTTTGPASTSRQPSRSASSSMYNTPIVQVYTAVRQ